MMRPSGGAHREHIRNKNPGQSVVDGLTGVEVTVDASGLEDELQPQLHDAVRPSAVDLPVAAVQSRPGDSSVVAGLTKPNSTIAPCVDAIPLGMVEGIE